MHRKQNIGGPFARPLDRTEDRRFGDLFENIARNAERKPSMIYSFRHNRAAYHCAPVLLAREVCADALTHAQRLDAIHAARVLVAEMDVALLAMLEAETRGNENEIIAEAQRADLMEDIAEKEHDLQRCPQTAAEWLTRHHHQETTGRALQFVLRRRALSRRAPDGPRAA